MPLSLGTSVQYVKGVGPRWADTLARRGILTVEDLLYMLPFRYEDRSHLRPIQALLEGEAATVLAQVQHLHWIRTRKGQVMLRMTVSDGTGSLLCSWYNAAYLRERLQSGQTVALFGRLERDHGQRALLQPELEILDSTTGSTGQDGGADPLDDSLRLGRIVPVYEAIAGLSSGWLRRFIHRALAATEPIPDSLPLAVRQQFTLLSRADALQHVHFPPPGASLEALRNARTPAHVSLIFEELFYLQSGLELKRRRVRRVTAPRLVVDGSARESLKRILPFHPTQDQKQVLREIAADLGSGRPMRRLLQGDVGSGKTIVALQAAAIAMENGFQVALMAPTQILAEQHYLYARARMPHYRVALVTAASRPGRGQAPQLAIGTQALLQDSFPWTRLGLVVVDEQHRFGVLQRFQLMQRGAAPVHLLVMTATPIPRTLGLALYGDLDTSAIRHGPPGAMPIVTRLVPEARAAELYEFVRRLLRGGRQAYFVYPLIEESEVLDLKPALRMFEQLRRVYAEFRVGILHGRLSQDEKSAVMDAFRAGKIQVLVATTVVEVGLDVPNATVMVIEHAERFGIAQLHQLRGRVGRPQPPGSAPPSAARSCCFLLHADDCGELAQRRLQAVAATRDGFALAEVDLRLRGPGEFFGTRQSGRPVFAVADPIRDLELMEQARTAARDYIEHANSHELRLLVAQIQQRWQRRYGLIEVG
ncbi:MAG: ATP-dependent DNA helicase RecG [Terriglobales bacterium]